jgi:uroporphyrinogen-III synthase
LTDAPDVDSGARGDQLAGFRIGVTSNRRSEDLIAALQRRGAQVLHAPALVVAPDHQDEALVEETMRVIAARPEVVLVTTGYGMRRWLEVADAAGLGVALTEVLSRARLLGRGPKSVGAIRAAGLSEAALPDAGSTAALVDQVVESGCAGMSIAVQLHGYTDTDQLERLRRAGAAVLAVTPYRWAAAGPSDRLAKLIDAVCRSEVDAITFTSAPAVDVVLEAARAAGRLESLCTALRSDVLAAAVGPVTAGPLVEAGVTPVQPERYRLGALIRLVCERLERRVVRLRASDVQLELRGRSVLVDRRPVPLGPHALGLLKALATTDGVVARHDLRGLVGADDHALEVAMSRLRRSLAVPGLITTVVRRGYRLNATRL